MDIYGGIMMNRFRGFLLHTGVICSFACIAAKVLDWYNPYMDFTGHIRLLQLVLYFAVILLAFVRKPQFDFAHKPLAGQDRTVL